MIQSHSLVAWSAIAMLMLSTEGACQESSRKSTEVPILPAASVWKLDYDRVVALSADGSRIACQRSVESPKVDILSTWSHKVLDTIEVPGGYRVYPKAAMDARGRRIALVCLDATDAFHTLVYSMVRPDKPEARLALNADRRQRPYEVAFDAEAMHLGVVGGNGAHIWRRDDSQWQTLWRSPLPTDRRGPIRDNSLAFSPDGTQVAIAGRPRGVEVHRLSDLADLAALKPGSDNLPQRVITAEEKPRAIGFSADSKHIFCSCAISNEALGFARRHGFHTKILSLDSDQETKRVYGVSSSAIRKTFASPYSNHLLIVQPVGRDGGVVDGNAALVVDVGAPSVLGAVQGGSLRHAAFAKDGKQLVGVTVDRSVFVWDIPKATPVGSLSDQISGPKTELPNKMKLVEKTE